VSERECVCALVMMVMIVVFVTVVCRVGRHTSSNLLSSNPIYSSLI
jgi:hypothetical protein